MARRGIAVDETVECTFIGSGMASERLLALGARDYRAVSVGAHRFQFARSYRPTWAIVIGIILTPVLIGLFFFLIRSHETWTAAIEEDHRRVRVRLSGRILPALLVAIRESMAAGPDAQPAFAPPGVATLPVHTPPGVVTQAPVATPAPYPAPAFAAPQPPAAPPAPAPSIGAPPGADPAAMARYGAPAAVPPPAPPAPPAAPASPVPPAGPSSSDVDGSTTRISADMRRRAAPRDLVLVFDTGIRQPMAPVVLIGREPAAAEGDVDPVFVAIDDPDRSVSKTHIAVRRADDGLWVLDRGSTNGSVVESPDGVQTTLAARRAMLVQEGWTVHFGTRSFTVDAGS